MIKEILSETKSRMGKSAHVVEDEFVRIRTGRASTSLLDRSYLSTAGQAELDLLIRTGGEHRLSNFLLWQAAYAELYFSDIYWPDFNETELDEALVWFASRKRRFGKIDEQITKQAAQAEG